MFRIFRHHLGFSSLFLAACEGAVLFALLTAIGRLFQAGSEPQDAALMTLGCCVAMSAVGLYNRDHLAQMRQVVSRAVVVLPLALAAILASLALHDGLYPEAARAAPYVVGAAGLTAFLPLLLLLRHGFVRAMDRFGTFRRRVAVIGDGAPAANIARLAAELGERTFTVAGTLPTAPADSIAEYCRRLRVDEVVVATPDRDTLPAGELLACKASGVAVTDYPAFWERESCRVDLDAVGLDWFVFCDGFRGGVVRSAVKRTFDVVVSLALLLLTLPLTLTTALLIRLESPGPIFYRQQRVGRRGRPFHILKFRSMRADAEKDGPRWAAANDARVTRIGAVIRKLRIDEIPQAVNVLQGSMSFVGPRPERPVFVEALAAEIPHYDQRHLIKPGITGWAQINYPYGATAEDARAKLSYDLYYVKNASLFLDLIVILQTVRVLLWHEGAR